MSKQKGTVKKRKEGRPSPYKKEYNEQVEKLCKLGATDKDIADFFNVCIATITNWKKKDKEFLAALKKGKQIADMNVAESLYKRATGYEHDDVELKVVSLGGNMGSQVEEVKVVKHYPPDPTSMIFWLKNRNPAQWRDRVEHNFDGEPFKVEVTVKK